MNLNHQKLSSYNSKESRWGDEEVLLVLQSSPSLSYISWYSHYHLSNKHREGDKRGQNLFLLHQKWEEGRQFFTACKSAWKGVQNLVKQ